MILLIVKNSLLAHRLILDREQCFLSNSLLKSHVDGIDDLKDLNVQYNCHIYYAVANNR